MHGSLMKMLVAVGAMVACCALVPSCRDNTETLFIQQIQAAPQPDCIVKPDITAPYLTRGGLDVALSTRYAISALIGNQLVARGDPKQVRAESNRIQIQGADVRLVDSNTGNEIANYSVIALGEADPASSATPGYGLASFELIPHSVGDKLHTSLQGSNRVTSLEAHFKVYGTTIGGMTVTSGEYAFPIDVCFGCSITFPADATDPAFPGPNCRAKASTSTTTVGGQTPACLTGQDGVTDCRSCQGNPVCTPCSSNAECAASTKLCLGGHCSVCVSDAQCGAGRKCSAGVCG